MGANFVNNGKPYIHSSLLTLQGQLPSTLTNSGASITNNLQQAIKQLESQRDILAKECADFCKICNVTSWQDLNRKIFGTTTGNSSFIQIAQRVLRNKTFVDGITRTEIDTSKLKNKELTFKDKMGMEINNTFTKRLKEILDNSKDETLTLQMLESKIGKSLKKSWTQSKNKGNLLLTYTGDFLEDDGEEIKYLKEVGNRLRSTSKDSKFSEYIDQATKNALSQNDLLSVIPFEEFKELFWRCFNQVKGNYTDISTEEAQNSKDDFIKGLYYAIKDYLTINKSKNIGVLGERGFGFTIDNQVTPDLLVSTIQLGEKSEKSIFGDGTGKGSEDKGLYNQLKSLNISKLNTYISDSKMTQTDFILYATNGERKIKAVRVQSKNSTFQDIQAQINRAEEGTDPTMYKIIKGTQDQNIPDLLNRFSSNLTSYKMTQNDVDIIIYLLSNALWLSIKGDYRAAKDGDSGSKGKINKRTRNESSEAKLSSLSYIFNTVEKILGLGMGNIIGLTLEEQSQGLKLAAGGSNIFYLVGVSTLIPTYVILEQIIKRLEGTKSELFNTRVVINKKLNTSYTAKSFWERKQEVMEPAWGEGLSGTYSDPVLQIGQTLGETVASQLTGHINLVFDMKKIFDLSSYNFQ